MLKDTTDDLSEQFRAEDWFRPDTAHTERAMPEHLGKRQGGRDAFLAYLR